MAQKDLKTALIADIAVIYHYIIALIVSVKKLMSKPTDKMLPYVMASIGIIGSFIGITTFFNSPVKDVRADVDVIKQEVSEDRVKMADRLGRIETSISGIERTIEKIDKKLK